MRLSSKLVVGTVVLWCGAVLLVSDLAASSEPGIVSTGAAAPCDRRLTTLQTVRKPRPTSASFQATTSSRDRLPTSNGLQNLGQKLQAIRNCAAS